MDILDDSRRKREKKKKEISIACAVTKRLDAKINVFLFISSILLPSA